jgi:serine/threonine protein kinase
MPLLNTGDKIDSSFIPGRYEVVAFVGEGGFGEVYRIIDRADDIERALKIISPRAMLRDPDALRWLEREAKAALAVTHPNAVRIFDYSSLSLLNEIVPFIVMEFLPDGDLAALIEQARKKGNKLFDTTKLLLWMEQLSLGLAAINQQLVHRDIKPQNVFRAKDELKIGDFGMAKYVEDATRTLTFKGGGTPLYMAPESYALETTTVATDIYSLGVMFYELATLRVPFVGRDIFALRDQHQFAPIPMARQHNSDLPEIVEAVIIKMMAKDPKQRYQNAAEIAGLLKSERRKLAAENEPTEESSQAVVNRFKSAVRSKIIRDTEQETRSRAKKQKLERQLKIRESQQHELYQALTRSVSRVNGLLSDAGLTDRIKIEGNPAEYLPEGGIRREEYLPGTSTYVRFLDAYANLYISIWEKDGWRERPALELGWVAVGWWLHSARPIEKRTAIALRLEADTESNVGTWMYAPITDLDAFNPYPTLEWEFVKYFVSGCDKGFVESNWKELTDATLEQWVIQLADQE